MTTQLLDLLYLCLTAAIPVIVPMLITLLYQAIGRVKDQRLRDDALLAVQAAQQAIPDTSDRYAYVSAMLGQRFPRLRPDQIQALIEASVHVVKTAAAPTVSILPASAYQATDRDPDDPQK